MIRVDSGSSLPELVVERAELRHDPQHDDATTMNESSEQDARDRRAPKSSSASRPDTTFT